jgi:hypothetical protein
VFKKKYEKKRILDQEVNANLKPLLECEWDEFQTESRDESTNDHAVLQSWCLILLI